MAQNLKCLCSQLPPRDNLIGIEGVIENILPGLSECLQGL